jgi:hypothetical protein
MASRLGLPFAYAYKPPRFYELRGKDGRAKGIRVERKDEEERRHRGGGLFRYLKYSNGIPG